MGDWAAMNAVPDDLTENDESTTDGGHGWAEDMELAPAHPGDRARGRAPTTARASGCRRCWPARASAPGGSART